MVDPINSIGQIRAGDGEILKSSYKRLIQCRIREGSALACEISESGERSINWFGIQQLSSSKDIMNIFRSTKKETNIMI